ncbi:MAG: DUF748 domain-containing protein, partial [Candidatus Electrothrix sp. AR3]|nr:DUF748 domain-containing protein [Candidatus Electrothrix sp. AR3]
SAASAAEQKISAQLSLVAKDGNTALSFQGSADPALNLAGKLTLQNMDANFFQPFLVSEKAMRFRKGSMYLTGLLRLDQADGKTDLKLSGSAIRIRNFALQHHKTTLLTGKDLNGTGCSVGRKQGIACDKMVLDQADFSEAAPKFFLLSGTTCNRFHFTSKNLELNDSLLRFRVPGFEEKQALITLSGLQLSLNEQKSLNLEAALDKGEKKGSPKKRRVIFKGKADTPLQLSGTITLENMSVDLLQPYLSTGEKLHFSKGSMKITGTLQQSLSKSKPEWKISGSSLAIKDFALHQDTTSLISGQSLNCKGCSIDGITQRISCTQAQLDQAKFSAKAPAFFLSSAKNVKRNFSFNTLEVGNSSARLRLPGTQIELPLSSLKLR